MFKKFSMIFAVLLIATFSNTSFAYDEKSLSEIMTELEADNPPLFKKAKKVVHYATINTNEIIAKPLLTKHAKALNAFVDRENKMSAKFYAVGTEGKESKLVMIFKFNGKKYKAIQNYKREKNCKKFSVCPPWEKVN